MNAWQHSISHCATRVTSPQKPLQLTTLQQWICWAASCCCFSAQFPHITSSLNEPLSPYYTSILFDKNQDFHISRSDPQIPTLTCENSYLQKITQYGVYSCDFIFPLLTCFDFLCIKPKEQYRNDGLTTLCYVFHESCWNNRGRLFLLLIWSSPVIHFCWIIFTPQWISGEASFSYWCGLPLLIIWLVEDIT